MTRPAQQNHKAVIFAQQQRQLWAVCVLILLGLISDWLLSGSISSAVITKNITAGAMLGFLGNLVFTRIAYRLTGAKARQAVMLNMYLGQMIKWAVMLVGFAVIFICVKPLSPAAVFVGFCALQVWHTVSMWRMKT